MRIKTFEAATMQEALLQARNELGEDAVVLNTKHVKTGGILGIGGADRIELMAAVDENAATAPAQQRGNTAVLERETVECETIESTQAISTQVVGQDARKTDGAAVVERTKTPAFADDDFSKLQAEVRELGSLVRSMFASQPLAKSSQSGLIGALGIDHGILNSHFSDCAHITDEQELLGVLSRKLDSFAAAVPLQQKEIVALVGPTGVGKTTTLAKLAAYFSLELGKSVAMVTADTFRIGAVEQLRTYARIMGIPLEIALSPEDVTEGVNKHSDKDIILIDTVGRSQRSAEHIEELQKFVCAANPTQTHLVISASCAKEVQEETIKCFAPLSPTHLVVTKLDEAPDKGCLVNLPVRSGLGISCLTDGQNVPQDIEFASGESIAKRLLEVA